MQRCRHADIDAAACGSVDWCVICAGGMALAVPFVCLEDEVWVEGLRVE
jgi:hypothetical protein